MGMALYSLLLVVGLAVCSPWWLARMVRYRAGMAQRLGRVPAELRAAAAGRQVVWVHAVSVGEVLAGDSAGGGVGDGAGRGVGGGGFDDDGDGAGVGAGEVWGRIGAVFYYPLDFAWAVRAYLRALRPKLLVLMESELWPRMLVECGRAGVPVAVVNARVSDRSYARAMRVRAVWGRVLRRVDLFLAQSEEDARRLVAMGARAEAVRAIGNLKYDVRAAKASRVAELIQEAAAGRPIVVAGSTVASTEQGADSEEAQVVYGWMKGALPSGALLVLAPRHPERFDEAWQIAFDFPALRATDLLAGKRRENAVQRQHPDGESLDSMDIILLDTIGDLASVYGIADVAYVGGSMMERGGHNPLEPAQFGVPVVMGPSYENFREIVGKMMRS